MRRVCLSIVSLCTVTVLISWAISFWIPHGFDISLHRKYGIHCERGTVQFRLQTQSVVQIDLSGKPSVVEIGLDGAKMPTPPGVRETNWDAKSIRRPFDRRIRVVLSPWRPIQTAECLWGGYLPRKDATWLPFGYRVQVWGVAHWVLAIPLTLLSAWLLRREVMARRIGQGCCSTCGYDLRATPDRCPECGTVPKAAT